MRIHHAIDGTELMLATHRTPPSLWQRLTTRRWDALLRRCRADDAVPVTTEDGRVCTLFGSQISRSAVALRFIVLPAGAGRGPKGLAGHGC